jgi:hypothetical protein
MKGPLQLSSWVGVCDEPVAVHSFWPSVPLELGVARTLHVQDVVRWQPNPDSYRGSARTQQAPMNSRQFRLWAKGQQLSCHVDSLSR